MNPEINHRLLVPVQARGNVGKSTVLGVLASWLDQRSVEWHGFDLDPDHRCLERMFPEAVSLVPLGDEPEGDVVKLLRSCTTRPVTLIDPRAHLNEVLLRTWEMIRFHYGPTDENARSQVPRDEARHGRLTDVVD